MHRLASWLALAVTISAAGCGGTVESRTGPSATAAGGDSGHVEQTATGGRPGVARDGGAGSGGTGSTDASVDRCTLPIDTRQCDGGTTIAHDPTTGTCKNLGNLVCPNNANVFRSLQECLSVCPGSRPDVRICDTASDCVLTLPGCCGPCEPLGESAFTSVNRQRVSDPGTAPGCPACGQCPVIDPLSATGQYFIPDCLNAACIVTDIRKTSMAACTADSDCRIRDGADCCEGCDGQGLVAVSTQAKWSGGCPGGCPACAPPISSEYVAVCRNAVCTVLRRAPPPPPLGTP